MMKRLTFFWCAVCLLSAGAWAQETIVVTDNDLTGDSDVTWTSENTYVLDGLVYLEGGGTLTIEAGTVIQGATQANISTGDNASALIIARDAQIFARGTANEPIIFTSDNDDVDNPDDLSAEVQGQWGGIIILGNAPISFSAATNGIEGIDADEERARYGGNDPEDNSGVLRYVSIRHGGFALSSGNEINGLTLGGVGSGTEIDFIEVFANLDDGIEWFGGTVDVRHASVAFCGDDAMDYDLGWQGRGQFWFVLQEPEDEQGTGRAGEHDGASPDDVGTPSMPVIYNATYIGVGSDAEPEDGDASDSLAFSIVMRDNAGGQYWNSIFTGYNGAAIGIEARDDETPDSYDRFQAGELAFRNNIFEDFGFGEEPEDIFKVIDPDENAIEDLTTTFATSVAQNNTVGSTGIAGIGRTPNGELDPRINAEGEALSGGEPNTDDEFFSQVTYRGAFGNNANWLEGWTALSDMGYLGDLVERQDNNTDNCINVTDADLPGGTTTNWTADNCYNLDGLVYLEEDGILEIEAGTVIRGLSSNSISTGDNASALIITRDAQIFARGEAEAPIIFTSERDDVDNPDDLGPTVTGEWGGLIVLGDAPIAFSAEENGIEGIDADEVRARYGGDEEDDNSGIINYISIRHGGFALSGGNEINGLTLGGVGSGTEIDYVEVYANADDGIEWFGGTVTVDHAAVAYCGDDGMDYDLGWQGGGQYWFVIQGPTNPDGTGRSGEHDGASPDEVGEPSTPTIYNATYIGIGQDEEAEDGDASDSLAFSVVFRDNAGGYYRNSIFTDFNAAAIAVEDRDGDDDSFARLQAGDLEFTNNIFYNFGMGTDPESLFLAIDEDEEKVESSTEVVAQAFMNNGNIIVDTEEDGPVLNNIIERDEDGANVDPRAYRFGIAATGAPDPMDGEDFDDVDYYGAFEPAAFSGESPSWLNGWTALATTFLTGDFTNSVGNQTVNGITLEVPFPNPASDVTNVQFELPRAGQVTLTVFDLMGRPISQLRRQYNAGQQTERIDVSSLPSGNYLIVMDTQGSRILQRMVVSH